MAAKDSTGSLAVEPTVVTIWHTYGPYHLARARALEAEFGEGSVICFSHRSEDSVVYPFFNKTPQNHRVIRSVDGGGSGVRAFWSTFSLLRIANPRLILSCGYERIETLGAVIYCRLYGRKIFLMLDNQFDDRQRSMLIEWIKRLYLKLFDGFVYGGDTHRDYLRILKVPPMREVYGYNCVDNEWIQEEAEAARRSGKRMARFEKYFLCIARLVKKKNLLNLITAYEIYTRECKERSNSWGLVIVGEGAERGNIENHIANLHLGDKVQMTGQVDNFSEIVNYHAHARAFVLNSDSDEQWGLVVNEAMAAGRPVLVSRQCGCASSLVEEGSNGFTFDGRNPVQLAEHFVWMHRNEHVLDRMGRRSRQIIDKFSPAQFARNVMSLYRENDLGGT